MKTGYLFKKKDKTATSGIIYLALYFKDDVELISTGQRIEAGDWDQEKRYICSRKHLAAVDKTLTDIKSQVQKAEIRLQAKEKTITPFAVKQEYLVTQAMQLQQQTTQDKRSKEDRKAISFLANQWLQNDLFQYQPSTQKAVKESINQFLDFLIRSGRGSVSRQELDKPLITSYEKYLQDKKHLANSTHGKRMKHLRWFLRSLDFDVSGIKIRSHRKEIIALTQPEIDLLEGIDVSRSSELQKAKDLFLLGCYTGLRISDLKRVTGSMVIDGKICFKLQKNRKDVTIPVVPKAKVILSRYNEAAPKLAEQVLNRTIKDVCEEAGIKSLTTVRINVAGRDQDQSLPKFKLISSHTASKTFISLAPTWYGLTPAEVAAIVGKDLKTLLNHYYQLPRESAVKKMQGAI